MKLRLSGTRSIYEEIYTQYKNYIKLGVFSDGEKLPSVRELAHSLGINPNTVERAYTVLAEEGLVVTMPKKGVFVVGTGADIKSELYQKAQKDIIALHAAGMSKSDLTEIIKNIYKGEKKTKP